VFKDPQDEPVLLEILDLRELKVTQVLRDLKELKDTQVLQDHLEE
jgi:hypothetical protein